AHRPGARGRVAGDDAGGWQARARGHRAAAGADLGRGRRGAPGALRGGAGVMMGSEPFLDAVAGLIAALCLASLLSYRAHLAIRLPAPGLAAHLRLSPWLLPSTCAAWALAEYLRVDVLRAVLPPACAVFGGWALTLLGIMGATILRLTGR